jgi:hypothetical protein
LEREAVVERKDTLGEEEVGNWNALKEDENDWEESSDSILKEGEVVEREGVDREGLGGEGADREEVEKEGEVVEREGVAKDNNWVIPLDSLSEGEREGEFLGEDGLSVVEIETEDWLLVVTDKGERGPARFLREDGDSLDSLEWVGWRPPIREGEIESFE